MENWWKYCLSLVFIISAYFCVSNSDRLSNETYHHLDPNEKRKLSSDYLALSEVIESGSPKSMRLLEKAARINPQNEQVWMELSWPYLRAGHYNEWHEYINKAIKLNPKEWQGTRGIVKLHHFRDYGGALYDFLAHDTIKTDIAYYGLSPFAKIFSTEYLKGLCYLGLQNHSEAKTAFKLYIEKENKKTGSFEIIPSVYSYLALIENDDQNYTAALQQLEPAFKESKPLADAYYQAAYSNFMLGKAIAANELISTAEELFNEGHYFKNYQTETLFQLYLADIVKLKEEIACFL